MQNIDNRATEKTAVNHGIVIQPKDILSIVVTSRYPELVSQFNLPLPGFQSGSSSRVDYSHRLLGYQVDMDGNIDFPLLGKLKVTGLTREQLSAMIKQKLFDADLVRDAIIVSDFMNFKISVLGEVRSPGTFSLEDDRITLFEALGKAGDLTIYGRRDNVLVRRDQDGVINYYRIDLRSSAITQSPVFYLQQNDVVYVEPNKTYAARTDINENKSLSTLISLASLLLSLTIVINNLTK